MLNLDTHILIKAFEGSLTQHERNVLTADPEWSISDRAMGDREITPARPASLWARP